MKILLVQPVKDKRHTLNLMPPLGLGYLASSVRPGHDVKILDCVKENFNMAEFKVYIEKNAPDVVGFTAFSCDLDSVKKSIKVAKEINPGIITVAGGPHPSGDPEGTMRYIDFLDFVLAGEAENGFPLFIEQLSKEPQERNFKDIPGLVWRENGKINSNPKIFVENLDTIKFPSWDLLGLDKYKGVPNGVFTKQYPFAPIIVTRGCPYLCTFCSAHNIVGRKLRYRSIDNVMEEIKILYSGYGIREIHIEDDNFTFDIEFAKEFCRRLIKLNLSLTYSCPNGVRLDRIDMELLSLMKRAGFYNIYVGIESGSPRILKHMRKNLSLEEISKKVDLIKEAGLEVSGYFILGYPEESMKDMEMTISFAMSLKLDWAQFATFIPIPGSDIMNDEYVKKVSESISWSDFFNTDVPFAPRGISREQLKKMQKRAFLKFYLRPGKIINLIKKLRFDNASFIFRRVMLYLFK
jgi:anaerobic magnesium-protoporphyrin IX monomethyl ester cyclase